MTDVQRTWEDARRLAKMQEPHSRACECGHRHPATGDDKQYARQTCVSCPCTSLQPLFVYRGVAFYDNGPKVNRATDIV